jgi:hypothetical protein
VFIRLLPLSLFSLGWGSLSLTATPPAEPLTATCKRVSPLEIKADVYLPGGGPEERPVVVYLYGVLTRGSFLMDPVRARCQGWVAALTHRASFMK